MLLKVPLVSCAANMIRAHPFSAALAAWPKHVPLFVEFQLCQRISEQIVSLPLPQILHLEASCFKMFAPPPTWSRKLVWRNKRICEALKWLTVSLWGYYSIPYSDSLGVPIGIPSRFPRQPLLQAGNRWLSIRAGNRCYKRATADYLHERATADYLHERATTDTPHSPRSTWGT